MAGEGEGKEKGGYKLAKVKKTWPALPCWICGRRNHREGERKRGKERRRRRERERLRETERERETKSWRESRRVRERRKGTCKMKQEGQASFLWARAWTSFYC